MKNNKSPKLGKASYAFVVDGECEKWYLEMLRENEKDKNITVKPELKLKMSIKEQYERVKELAKYGYNKVFWIIDFDTLNKEQAEAKKGKNIIAEFYLYYDKIKANKKIVIIINNPCLEYWFLLHFKQTSKYYNDYNSLLPNLKKYLPDYEKSEKYYKKKNKDIYKRLSPLLNIAKDNALKLPNFNIQNTHTGLTEMHLIFNELNI